MTQRQKEINALKSIGFSEQTAAALLFIAERFGGGEPAEPQKLVGYVTTICDGSIPLQGQSSSFISMPNWLHKATLSSMMFCMSARNE